VDRGDGTESVSLRIPNPAGADAVFARLRVTLVP